MHTLVALIHYFNLYNSDICNTAFFFHLFILSMVVPLWCPNYMFVVRTRVEKFHVRGVLNTRDFIINELQILFTLDLSFDTG